jgi:hypothetical protein
MVMEDNGDIYILMTTPHAVWKYTAATGVLTQYADLSGLTTAPTDMCLVEGKIFLSVGSSLWVLDRDTEDLAIDLHVPAGSTDSLLHLVAADDVAYVLPDTDNTTVYSFTYPEAAACESYAGKITRLFVVDSQIYGCTSTGILLSLSGATWSAVAHTEQTDILSMTACGGAIFAGTGASGKIFGNAAGGWLETVDLPLTNIKALTPFYGFLYAGGEGDAANYLWADTPDGWTQSLQLPNETSIHDAQTYAGSAGDQLFCVAYHAEVEGHAAGYTLYRIERSEPTGVLIDTTKLDMQLKLVKQGVAS